MFNAYALAEKCSNILSKETRNYNELNYVALLYDNRNFAVICIMSRTSHEWYLVPKRVWSIFTHQNFIIYIFFQLYSEIIAADNSFVLNKKPKGITRFFLKGTVKFKHIYLVYIFKISIANKHKLNIQSLTSTSNLLSKLKRFKIVWLLHNLNYYFKST